MTGAGDDTLTAGDKIVGGSGTDTINLFDDANAAAFAAGDITGVEIVRAQTTNAGATALDVSGNADVTEAWLFNGTADENTVTLTKTQVGGLQGNVAAGAGGDDTVTFDFTADGATNDSVTIKLDGATADEVVVAGIETITLSVTGDNTLAAVDLGATTDLVINGAGDLDLTTAGDVLDTVDAAAATGDLTLNLAADSADEDMTVTTGSGDDAVTVSFADLSIDGADNANDTFDLGDGTDTIVFDDGVTLTSAANALLVAGISNVEVMNITGAGNVAIDFDRLSQTKLELDTTGTIALTDVASADTVEFQGADFSATNSVAMKLGQNTLKLNLLGDDTDEANVTSFVVTGASTVNVNSQGDADLGTANVLELATDDNGTVNLTGDYDLTLTLTNNGGTTGLSLAAGSFTGDLAVTGTADTDAIVSGSGDDTIIASVGGDSLTGGAGDDTFDFALTTEDATITDFSAAGDVLDLADLAGILDFVEAAVNVSTADTLAEALDLAAAGDDADGQATWFQFDGNTYVVFDGTDGGAFTALTDLQITLTGLVDLTADNVVIA